MPELKVWVLFQNIWLMLMVEPRWVPQRDLRSVLLYGGRALAITLPAWWAKQFNIKPGDKLEVGVARDGSLILTPPAGIREDRMEIEINAKNKSYNYLVKEIMAAYTVGFKKIRVVNSDRTVLRKLKKLLETVVLGLSVLDESENTATFYSITDLHSIGFMEALKQEFKVANRMLKLSIEGLANREGDVLETVVETDTVVDKLYLYIARILTSTLLGEKRLEELGLISYAEIPILYLSAKSIERVADHAVIIASNGSKLAAKGRNVSRELLDALGSAADYFSRTGKALVYSGLSENQDLFKAPEELMGLEGLSLEEARILDSTRRIIRYSLDIAESVVELNIIRKALGMG